MSVYPCPNRWEIITDTAFSKSVEMHLTPGVTMV